MTKAKRKLFGSRITNNYRLMISDAVVRYSFIVGFLCIIFSIIYLFFMTGRLPSEVPLYYSLPWGEERLADTLRLLYIPAVSGVFVLVNAFIIINIYSKEPVLSRLLAITAGFVSFLGAYTLIRIILLIT